MYRTFNIRRTCGKCNGSGKGGSCPKCYLCEGFGSKLFSLYAHDLTEYELRTLPNHQRMTAIEDIDALNHRNYLARKASLTSEWEKEVKTHKVNGKKGTVEVPIQEMRVIKRDTKAKHQKTIEELSDSHSVNNEAWRKAILAEERDEKENKETHLGTRSNGLHAQRMIA